VKELGALHACTKGAEHFNYLDKSILIDSTTIGELSSQHAK